jgi:STE20-like kinase
VAIKAINLEEYEKASKLQEDVRKEINIMAKCNHPNLIKQFCSFIAEKELWIVCPLLDCCSLKDMTCLKFEDKRIKDEVMLASILKQVIEGLTYFH